MNVEFKEEYWNDALAVLEREERAARNRKFLPWIILGVAAIVTGTVFFAQILLAPSNGLEFVQQIDVIETNSKVAVASLETPLAEDSIEQEAQGQIEFIATDDRAAHSAATPASSESGSELQTNDHLADAENKPQYPTPIEKNAVEPTTKEPIDSEDTSENTDSNNAPVPSSTLVSDEERAKNSILAVEKKNDDIESNLELDNASNIGDSKVFTSSRLTPLTTSLDHGVAATLKFRGFTYHEPFPFKEHNFYAFAGNSFLTGYGSRKGELAFNPEVGLGYERVLAKNWSATLGLSYFQIGGITHAAEFAQTELGFGRNTTLTTIETHKLHFMNIPITLNWDFNKRNAVVGGLAIEALVNGLSEVTVTQIDDFSENQISQTTDWGYTQGYRTINGALLLGYEFRVTKNLTFGAHYSYGLREITKSNVYGQEFRDRNSRLRAFFRYSIR